MTIRGGRNLTHGSPGATHLETSRNAPAILGALDEKCLNGFVGALQTPLPKQDDNTYPPTATALSKATDFFITGIKKRVAGKLEASIAEQAPTADAAKGVLLIRGEVLELNPGSRAARYWVGFGAGKSRAEIKGEIVNAETGAPLLKFSHARASSMGEGGGDYTTFLDDDIREVGEDIGKMLLSFEEGRP
jgi:hypothetical protein